MTRVFDVTARRTELFGREADVRAVRSFLDACLRGAALVVAGAPGLGKTAIAEATAEDATRRGFAVARVRGDQFGGETFAALRRLLGNHLHRATSLPRASREALAVALDGADGETPGRLLLTDAVLDLLTAVALHRPLLLVVDDLQWVDRASAGVLALVARRVTGRRVGFLGTMRTGDAGFFESVDLPELELHALEPNAARRTLDAHHPDLGPQVAARVLAQAGGNPLALIELPTALTEGQRKQTESLPEVLPLTGRLSTMFAGRIAALPAPTRQLLLLAALDDAGDVRVHLAAAGHELDELAAAETARLVTVDVHARRVSFRHPLVRAAVVDVADDDEKRRAHRVLAASLRHLPEQRARHLAAASTGRDEDVAAELEAAARDLLRRGEGVGAVDALVLAADLSASPHIRRRRLAAAAYLGADVTGDLGQAAALLEARPDTQWSPVSLETAVAAAQLLLNGDGDVTTAHRLVVAALADTDVGDRRNRVAVVEALHTLQLICFFSGDARRWAAYRETLLQLPAPVPVPVVVCSRTFSDPVRLARDTEILSELDTAIGAVATADPINVVRLAQGAVYVDRLGGLRRSLWSVVHGGRSGRAVASGINALMLLAFDSWFSGQWDETQLLANEGINLCEKHGYRLLVWPGRLALALVAAARGDEETVMALTDDMLRWATPRGVRAVQQYAWQARCLAALTNGATVRAVDDAARVSPPGELASHVPHALWVALDLVEAAASAGRPDVAAAHSAVLVSERVSSLSPRMAFVVAAARALSTAASPGVPLAEQRALFEVALAQRDAERWPFEHARVQLAYGQLLRREACSEDARPHLQAALHAFRGLGARPWSVRAADALRASGIPMQADAAPGPVTLTQQELDVVTLAASGLTNRQIGQRLFLSHRTVGSALYRAFPKLGVTTRAALRDALRGVD